MKQFIIILWGLFALAAAGLPVTWWIARAMSAPVQYQYATFRWPAGTTSALFNFKPGDLSTNDDEISCRTGALSDILDQAHDSTGFDYFSAAGDTVILRRAVPARPDDPLAGRTNLWVVPNPPESDSYPHLGFQTIGHVKSKN